ncbi:hypothetical protein SAY87_014880 [Trapa incisa]|uniref:N-acetyl-D-glucosamine kinase n=1 Tax=Trapa incisa TaxID=236973 RepID=A0AAN7GTB7_9MYRT|nr:hypothetical protein SAY87_014880 [Trapa incisa]
MRVDIVDWDFFHKDLQLNVQNDAVAALASGTLGKLHGCVLIAGTGTIAYGFTEDGREARAAGAGPTLGDWGSMLSFMQILLGPELQHLSLLWCHAAEAGDEMANKILYDSVEELALSVKAVVQRLGLSGKDGKDSFPLVMVGGVLLEVNKTWDIGHEVIKCISKDYPGALPIRPKVESDVGAALLAWSNFMKEYQTDHY